MSCTDIASSTLAYTAGILDGEGCLGIVKGKSGQRARHTAYVTVVMSDKELVLWLQQQYGGGFHLRPTTGNRAVQYSWHISNRGTVAELLTAVLPYLRVKRTSALLLLEFLRCYRHLDEPGRDQYHEMAKLANARGSSAPEIKSIARLAVVGV